MAFVPMADVHGVAEIATAIGTLLAVAVALYTQPFREWRQRPVLTLSLGSNSSGIGLGDRIVDEAHAVGLRITASRRRKTAHDVEVFATADWFYLEQKTSLRAMDHEPLRWIGGSKSDHPTVLSLGPGVSREVSLLKLGRPLDLYEPVGLPRPTGEQVEKEERETSSFAVLDVNQVGTFGPFLHNHLVYRFRFDVTATDVDTVSYETWMRIDQIWGGQPVPTSGSALAQAMNAVEIVLNWSPLAKITAEDDAPQTGKLWIGRRPPGWNEPEGPPPPSPVPTKSA
jgi:hypothetical protein